MRAVLKCLCLTGPTACGKSALALAAAECLPIEIVSMDSALVYRGLDIGTDKPTAAMRAAVPHHLIDIVEPQDRYSAGRFVRDAEAVIADVAARGRAALLVGGTLLYLKALREGLAPLPEADADLRATLDRQAEAHGWPAMHARLATVDPAAAARISMSDRQRIQRALEVYELTGRPLTALQRTVAGRPRVTVETLAVEPADRAQLAAAIERRFDAMVARGFIDEVRALRRRGNLDLSMPSIRSVGYRQIWRYLDAASSWPDAREAAIVATRRLAKRQLTWLRNEPRDAVLAAESPDRNRLVQDWLRRRISAWGGPAVC